MGGEYWLKLTSCISCNKQPGNKLPCGNAVRVRAKSDCPFQRTKKPIKQRF
jgi:hypothetical protein